MAASVLPNGAACAWPALLINISMRPKCAPACAKPACTDASTLTSSTQMATLPACPASSSCRQPRAVAPGQGDPGARVQQGARAGQADAAAGARHQRVLIGQCTVQLFLVHIILPAAARPPVAG